MKMTREEYWEIEKEVTEQKRQAKATYRQQVASFERERDVAICAAERRLREAKQAVLNASPFKVGDVVLAEHSRGSGWGRRPIEKCQITSAEVMWHYIRYEGVKTKKDGTFGNQVAVLDSVRPFTEQEAS